MFVKLLVKRSAHDINGVLIEWSTQSAQPELIAEELYKLFTLQTGLRFDVNGHRQMVTGMQQLIAANWMRLDVGEGGLLDYLLPAPPLLQQPEPRLPQREQQGSSLDPPVRTGPPAPPPRVPQSGMKRGPSEATLTPDASATSTAPVSSATSAAPPPAQPAPAAKTSPQGKAMKLTVRD